MIQEVTDKYDANGIEEKVHKLWDENDTYSKVREHRTGEKLFL